MSLNKTMLIGNLGRDPEIRYSQNQLAIVKLSVATTEKQKDSSGAWVDHTEWHRVTVFGKQGENCSNYLKKGSKIYVEGKLRTSKWQDKNGQDRYTTEIIADKVTFLDSKGAAGGYQAPASAPSADQAFDGLASADDLSGFGADSGADKPIQEDDIPF